MNKNILLIIISLFVILGVSFYWFEYRPAEIRRSCNDVILVGWANKNEINYKSCLRDNGLEN